MFSNVSGFFEKDFIHLFYFIAWNRTYFFLKFYKQMKTYNIFFRNPPTKMPLLKLRGIFTCKTIKCIRVSFQNKNNIANIKLPVN